MDLLAGGHGGDQAAGAGLHAGAAVGALLRVHNGGAVGADGHSAELAGVHTGAEAQAAEAALQRTGGNLGGREAVLHAHILKALLGCLAAVAADESYLTLTGGSSHAHDLSDGGSIVGACGSASGDRSVAGQNGSSAAAAAGVAAAAAVSAGQMAEDSLLAGILFDLKDLGSHGQDQSEQSAQSAQNCDSSNNISHLSYLLTKPSGRRSP